MKLTIKTFTFSALLCLSYLPAVAETPWITDGFEMPESIEVLADRAQLVVSNIKGHPAEADGEGYLSLMNLSGDLIEKEWVTGLDAPKGMARVGAHLIVADLQRLHVIELETGQVSQSIDVPGAIFLNDVTSDGTTAWISDFVAHKIYAYQDGEISVFMEGGALSHPNGLLYEKGALLVGNWGIDMKEDFTTQSPGQLLSISLQTREVTALTAPFANIDGVVRIKDRWIISDYLAGKLYAVSGAGVIEEVAHYSAGLADIAAYEGQLFLPLMLDGAVTTWTP